VIEVTNSGRRVVERSEKRNGWTYLTDSACGVGI
jgi:hypothetical protein